MALTRRAVSAAGHQSALISGLLLLVNNLYQRALDPTRLHTVRYTVCRSVLRAGRLICNDYGDFLNITKWQRAMSARTGLSFAPIKLPPVTYVSITPVLPPRVARVYVELDLLC